jgi:hypothetical protein
VDRRLVISLLLYSLLTTRAKVITGQRQLVEERNYRAAGSVNEVL